jgi:WD40-like Beta Propeller Repeat
MNPKGRVLVAGMLAVIGLAWCVPPAGAVFPGSNGKIALVTESYGSPGCGECDPGGQRAWIIGRDGQTASFRAASVAFSSSGSRIAYEPYPGSSRIWIARPDGSKPRLLTGAGWSPVWSPVAADGIAYIGASGPVVTRASGGEKRVLPTAVGGRDGELAWAPNGEQLAFTGFDSVSVIGADGQNLQTVTTKTQDYTSFDGLAWASTGWLSYRFDDELWITRPGRTDESALVRRLTSTLDSVGIDYSWSADGQRIAFLRDGSLWVIAVPDGKPRLVVPRKRAGYLPQWSPDGRRIAYVRGQRILTVSARGGQPKEFGRFNDRTTQDEYVADIDWQPRPR